MSNLPTDPAARRARLIRHLLPWLATVCCGHALAASVHPRVLENAAANNSVDVLLVYADQATPSFAPLRDDGDARVRRRHLVEALKSRAGAAQHATRSWLDARGIAHRDFWIANMIQARVPRGALAELAARADIARIDPNPAIGLHLPPADADPGEVSAGAVNPVGIAWGVAKIEAPLVWQAGHTGEGMRARTTVVGERRRAQRLH